MRTGEEQPVPSGTPGWDVKAVGSTEPTLLDALGSPEGLLRTILDNTTEGLVLVDSAGRILWGSPSIRDVLGYDPEGWVGHQVLEFVHPDDVVTALPSLLRVTSGRTTGEPVVVRARHADGGMRWVEALTKRVHGDADTGGAMFSLRDITARVEAERGRIASEARLKAYLENSRDLTLLVDDAGVIRWVSGNVEEMIGHRADDLLGTQAFDLVHPDHLDEALERFAGVVSREGPPVPLLLDVRRADGTWVTVEALGSTMPGAEGEGGILVNIRDATVRMEAERALRASEVRFRTVMQNSYDVVAVIDQEGVIKWVTPNSVRLLGWTPEEVVGTNGLDLVHPDDLDLMVTELLSFASGAGVPNPTTIKMRHRDGSWRHVELVGTDLLENPDIAGIALNLRGVDERVAAEQLGRRLTDILELTNDLVGITAADGQVAYFNEAAQRFFGVEDVAEANQELMISRFTRASLHRVAHEVGPALQDGTIWIGELEVVRADGVVVPMLAQMITHRDSAGAVEFYSGVYRDISERKQFESRLEHEATHDPLTGLPNRSLLLDRLEQALARARRRTHSVAVLFCDLDHFKVVNDSLGHTAGDRLLVDIARRLEGQLRPGDTVSRFGGDEFVLLCEDLDDPGDAVVIAERVHDAVRESFHLDANEIHVGISVGIAVAAGGVGEPEALIRDADAAMYRAKASGRSRHEVFEAAMWEQAVDRFDLTNALNRALAQQELELHYQPIIDLANGRVCSLEALVRWRHPQRGFLMPDEFIGLAEDSGAIVELGAWVLGEACRQLRRWQRGRPGLELTMAVNLSARQLDQPDIVDRVADVLERTGLDPERLDLEITETVLMADVARSEAQLGRLKALGVSLSVDDFGTGYSSMSYLRRFPVDRLKVDGSFVGGLGSQSEDSAIVEAIVNLAHTLGLGATAEGVETPRQREILTELGCDRAQGYLLAEPRPSHRVESLLDALC